MILSNPHFNELNVQLHSLLLETGFSLSPMQMRRFLLISYQQCFNRLQRMALLEGLIDKKITNQSIITYLDLLKIYSN